MTAATLRVRRPSGALATFDAERVDCDNNGLVTARGRWRDDRRRQHRTYTWRARQIIEIRWAREAAA